MVAVKSPPSPPLKPTIVNGNSSSDDAKIGGITPAVLSLSGMWFCCRHHLIALLTFRVLHNDTALRAFHEHDERDGRRRSSEQRKQEFKEVELSLTAQLKHADANRARQARQRYRRR
jgi:hypothetical protein